MFLVATVALDASISSGSCRDSLETSSAEAETSAAKSRTLATAVEEGELGELGYDDPGEKGELGDDEPEEEEELGDDDPEDEDELGDDDPEEGGQGFWWRLTIVDSMGRHYSFMLLLKDAFESPLTSSL